MLHFLMDMSIEYIGKSIQMNLQKKKSGKMKKWKIFKKSKFEKLAKRFIKNGYKQAAGRKIKIKRKK